MWFIFVLCISYSSIAYYKDTAPKNHVSKCCFVDFDLLFTCPALLLTSVGLCCWWAVVTIFRRWWMAAGEVRLIAHCQVMLDDVDDILKPNLHKTIAEGMRQLLLAIITTWVHSWKEAESLVGHNQFWISTTSKSNTELRHSSALSSAKKISSAKN